MKTAVSIPDELFKRAERFARQKKESRSKLFARALDEYLGRHEGDSITEAINRTIAEVGEAPDPFLRAAARRVFEQTEW